MADSTSLVLYDPRTADPEVIALAGFLAGYAWWPPASPRGPGPRTGITAGPQRPAHLGGARRRHRGSWPGAGSPHAGGPPQGRQDRHHPSGPPHCPRRRPGHRRAPRRADLLDVHGQRLRRDAAARVVRRLAKRTGIAKRIGLHSLRHSFIAAALDAGVPLRDVQEAASHADPRTTMPYDRARQSLDRHATYIVATFVAGASRGDAGSTGRRL